MDDLQKKVWFEGISSIDCDIQVIEKSLSDIGKHYTDVISLMSGLTSVELVESGENSLTIMTNEGLMTRTNISIVKSDDSIIVQFDEEYRAGKTITTNSHFFEEFSAKDNKVIQRIIISDLKAPGFMGFFYRTFGSKNIGNAFLGSYKKYFEK